jgi:hypothetical protein
VQVGGDALGGRRLGDRLGRLDRVRMGAQRISSSLSFTRWSHLGSLTISIKLGEAQDVGDEVAGEDRHDGSSATHRLRAVRRGDQRAGHDHAGHQAPGYSVCGRILLDGRNEPDDGERGQRHFGRGGLPVPRDRLRFDAIGVSRIGAAVA